MSLDVIQPYESSLPARDALHAVPESAANRRPLPRRTPITLRRVDAASAATSRLARPYRARCPLPEGGEADLLARKDFSPVTDDDRGLPLWTRFGPAIAFDYGPLLLAMTGIDITHACPASTHTALARYGIAALPPPLQAALGDPTVCDTPHPALMQEPTLVLNLRFGLPSIRLTMRLLITAAGVQALLDRGPWQRVERSASLPAWLTAMRIATRLIVGESVLPLGEYGRLACGDALCPTDSSFDVDGRATVRIASHRLQLRWLDEHHCFEVESMLPDPPRSCESANECAANAEASIDIAAIPIRLSFSLGTLSLTVGDVAEIGPGSLLKLEQGMPPLVKIEANGMPVGAGELVDLDGRLAVEITQWPQRADPRPVR